jgi:hypothetical protein
MLTFEIVEALDDAVRDAVATAELDAPELEPVAVIATAFVGTYTLQSAHNGYEKSHVPVAPGHHWTVIDSPGVGLVTIN